MHSLRDFRRPTSHAKYSLAKMEQKDSLCAIDYANEEIRCFLDVLRIVINEKSEERYRVTLGLISDGSLHLKVGEVDRQWKSRVIDERKVLIILENIALDSITRRICSSIILFDEISEKNRILIFNEYRFLNLPLLN